MAYVKLNWDAREH